MARTQLATPSDGVRAVPDKDSASEGRNLQSCWSRPQVGKAFAFSSVRSVKNSLTGKVVTLLWKALGRASTPVQRISKKYQV